MTEETDDPSKPKQSEQDLIETVAPPGARAYPKDVLIEDARSPDEVPTERPPITEPAESGTRAVDDVEELPPAKKA